MADDQWILVYKLDSVKKTSRVYAIDVVIFWFFKIDLDIKNKLFPEMSKY